MTSPTPRRILVVDDDPGCRLMLSTLVSRAGYTVDCVADGASALHQLRAVPPDLVLLDAHLPGVDGFCVCESIKGGGDDAAHPAGIPPVIMLTAFASDEARLRAVDAGADDFVPKPFRAEHLLELVSTLIAR